MKSWRNSVFFVKKTGPEPSKGFDGSFYTIDRWTTISIVVNSTTKSRLPKFGNTSN